MPLPEFVIKTVLVLLFAAAFINAISMLYKVAGDYDKKYYNQPITKHGKTN